MRTKWMLAAFGTAAAVGVATALVGGRGPDPAPTTDGGFAQSDAPQRSGLAPSEGSFFSRLANVPGDALAAPGGVPASEQAIGSPTTAVEQAADLGAELHLTEVAIESPPRVSEPRAGGAGSAPSREALTAANHGAAATSLCRRSGAECGSSADCCAGLACSGGVAGFGTSGHCEHASAR